MRKAILTLIALLLTLCQTARAAQDWGLPAQIEEILSGAAWDGYAVTQVDDLAPWGARDTVAAILSRGERNVLCVFAKADGRWKLTVRREKALYAGEQSVRLQFPDERHFVLYYEFGSRAEDYWFVAADAGKGDWRFEKARLWRDKTVDPATGDVRAQIVEVTPAKDGLSYRAYRFASDKPEAETSPAERVAGVIYTNLDAFNIATFPKSVDEAKRTLSLPPSLPAGARDDALPQGRTGAFKRDRKLPVYSGPSERYARAANGKASASTNDWIQVFGVEDGMALIQYAIRSDKARFGYISCEALEDAASFVRLAWAWEPVVLIEAADLTDDPLYTREAVARLPVGERVQYLGSFGESWAYVEWTATPPTRGFVPAQALAYEADGSPVFLAGRSPD